MPDTGNIVGLDDNDNIDKIIDCIKSIPAFVAGAWEDDRWVFDCGSGDEAFRGFLSRAGGVILVIGGTVDPDRTGRMIEFLKLRLGAAADMLTVDPSLAPEEPLERVPIWEAAGSQENNLTLAMSAMGRHETVFRRGNAIMLPDRSVEVVTRRGKLQQIGLAAVTPAVLTARLERTCFFHRVEVTRNGIKRIPVFPSTRIVKQILEYRGDSVSH